MDFDRIIASLHPLERSVLPFLKQDIGLNELVEKTRLSEIEVLRALQWLENKKTLKLIKEEKNIVQLDENGKKYIIQGLPEKQLLGFLLYREFTIKELKERTHLDDDEINFSIGILKKKEAININDKEVSITEYGKDLASKITDEERIMKSLPKDMNEFSKDELEILKGLQRRKKMVVVETKKKFFIKLSKIGEELSKKKIKQEFIENLTRDIVKEGTWKKQEFRRYDVKAFVPSISYGRRHFVNQAVRYVKRIWLDMGFKEMTGTNVQSSFWNFDALFVPQDHPARDLQDTFFIKNPEYANSPRKEILESVKKMHEKGGFGSEGWKYQWDEKTARKNVLRTHTTALSAITLANLNQNELPLKFFNVGKVYRNETMDYSHLFEFYQTEGIVIGDVNFRHLLGYLKEFFKKMGFEKARFRPGFFPYTTCSTEVEVFHPIKKKWIELGGAGILRPEVVIPLMGKDIKVLAWGLGLERIITPYYDINDLREIYNNDLKRIKKSKIWLK